MTGEHSGTGSDSTSHANGSHHPFFLDVGDVVVTSSFPPGTVRGRRTGIGILTASASGDLKLGVSIGETGQQDRDTIVKWAQLASRSNAAQVGDGERLVPLQNAAELKAGRGALYFPLPLGADASAWVYVGLEHARELRFPEFQAEPVPENWLETLSVLAAIFCLQSVPSRIQPSGRRMLGSCPAMLEVFETVARIGATEADVLICGETGTGKELVARSLHEASSRRSGPFVALNCAGLHGNTLRSELFGHERGAFTSADRKALGKFREANGGTFFMDEIGDMPLETQQILLRAIQERLVTPVGGTEVGFDARLVFATNKDLEALVRAGTFRADFRHRISIAQVTLPPLRDRGEQDIHELAHAALESLGVREKRSTHGFTAGALRAMGAYPWPGNVRELWHAVYRGLLNAAPGAPISAPDLRIAWLAGVEELAVRGTSGSEATQQSGASPDEVIRLSDQQLRRFLRSFVEQLHRAHFGESEDDARAAVEQALRPNARTGRACAWISFIRPRLTLPACERGTSKNALNPAEAGAFAALILRGASGRHTVHDLACSAAIQLGASDHGIRDLAARAGAPALAPVRTVPPDSGITGPASILDEKGEQK